MLEFILPDLSCGHCVKVVTQAVHTVDPQAQVAVQLDARRVRIDSLQPAARFRHALAEAGYPAAEPAGGSAAPVGGEVGAAASA